MLWKVDSNHRPPGNGPGELTKLLHSTMLKVGDASPLLKNYRQAIKAMTLYNSNFIYVKNKIKVKN